eukprot:GHVS01053458.1.p1 GENE.GHVS01053458.1~~GHVS01053458.1.p1  ORF type:complete len:108 (-),score=7.05 GHVS01053458.1:46-369(-)
MESFLRISVLGGRRKVLIMMLSFLLISNSKTVCAVLTYVYVARMYIRVCVRQLSCLYKSACIALSVHMCVHMCKHVYTCVCVCFEAAAFKANRGFASDRHDRMAHSL